MEGKGKKVILLASALLGFAALCLPLRSQDGNPGEGEAQGGASSSQKDSLIRLLQASSVQLIETDDGANLRKAVDATFLHSGTYFLCDTAYWSVENNIVNAIGNVKLTQEGTVLTSNLMDYIVEENLAKFRGGVVSLSDSGGNLLKTNELDYNTKDSVAVFSSGGSLKDKDGQIIESINGRYDSKTKIFAFSTDVNMFTDSIFIRTTRIDYFSDLNKAVFPDPIDFWKQEYMLSATSGWYDRSCETFFFTGNVHAMSKDQESWSDTLYFFRSPGDVLLLGQAQVIDTTRQTFAMARRIHYCDTLSRLEMNREAAVAIISENAEKQDTVWFGADTIVYRTRYMCDISESEKALSSERLQGILTDPVGEYRAKAALEAAKKAEEAAQNDVNLANKAKGDAQKRKVGEPQAPPQAPSDSLEAPADSVTAPLDTIPPAPDSTRVGFADAKGNVRVFRFDIQVRSDSLNYTDLDSIARFYIDPIVWNEGNRQYYSDSLSVLIRKGSVERVSLQSNAMVVTQETPDLYDQIKGAEILAYFDSTTALKRFDALGGANTIFYLQEKEEFSTVNKVECKMMSGSFVDANLDKVYYYDTPKNDAYPLAQLPEADRRMKTFRWNPELRPAGPTDITRIALKSPERAVYAAHPAATFKQTDRFFPGYIEGIYSEIQYRKEHPEAFAPKKELKARDANDFRSMPDSLSAPDSLIVQDSLAVRDSLSVPDSLSIPDSLAAGAIDSLSVAASDSLGAVKRPTKARLRREAAKARRDARLAKREARWAELDRIDAQKAAVKQEKARQRALEKKRKAIRAQLKEIAREDKIRQKYIDVYNAKKDRKPAGQIPALRED